MVYLIAGVLIGLSVGFHLGWYGQKIMDYVKALIDREPPTVEGVISPYPPGVSDVTNRSAVITPKTPLQIEYEEQQKIRNLQ